ncbi:cytokinin hydroxylase [Eucalyptus grandis]|uniref:Uncharacterized protein n=3 Tax=Eucalyptus grandis TaxID=71139 RepID=A0ACC3J806_EUCGR|nr:cytokinin hydroxylase [Eucalyptus grandis]KAK3409373.1 hypothetical protein EUGRSUZ_J01500 [Eucalyptus grandis]
MAVMATLLLLLVLLIVRAVYATFSFYWLTPRRIKKIMARQGVHGPEPRFLVGNLGDVSFFVAESTSKDMKPIRHDIVDRLLPHYVRWTKQYGKRFIYWNGVEPRLCLTEIDLIKELLSKYSTQTGKSWLQQQGSKHFIGRGLLMTNGDDWIHQRRIIAPAFMGDKLKSYSGFMVECTNQTLQSLQKDIDSGRTEIEIGEYMTRLTTDIISRTEFGSSYEKGKQIFHLLTVLQQRCAQASRHLCLPGSRFFPTRYNKEIKTLKMEVERLLMEIIESRKDCAEIGRSCTYGDDLLGMLLSEIKMTGRNKSACSPSMQVIMDECKTFFFAGHDTAALLLTWTIMLLATNRSWQDKVRAEVTRVCDGENPSVHHLPKLSLLNMVINESLRLYPPASLLPRMAFEDIKLGDLHVPKGLSIWIPVLAIHHSEELWGKDVNEFNPERFASKPFSSGRFMPFAMGQRNCVGQYFAMMEAKIILAMLVSRFSFTISDSYRHAPVTVLTVKPKYGVQICLKPLNPCENGCSD